ncbi:MAG: TraR/DksA family transcriptional regulator [Alphaproteobacteria bacterium]
MGEVMTSLEEYKKRLLNMKENAIKSVETSKNNAAPPELDQTAVGRLSRMDALQQQQMALSNKRRNEMMIYKVDQALLRIENGDYGFCIKCDEPINPKRLDLDPTTLSCIKCAEGDK